MPISYNLTQFYAGATGLIGGVVLSISTDISNALPQQLDLRRLWLIAAIAVVIPDTTNPQRARAEVVWLSIYYG